MKRGNHPFLLIYQIVVLVLILSEWTKGMDLHGPVFATEPPHRIEFSNVSGGRVDCTGNGSPQPEVEWIFPDGTLVQQIADLRILVPNGSLWFPPFPSERHRHDVHGTIYRCKLKSSLGTVLSRDVHVKAVVKENYDIQIHDEFVTVGNTAVFKCKIPNYVAEYVMVTAWIQDETIHIYPNTDRDGKYVALGNGDLYVNNVGPGDGYKSYACRTLDRLTGEAQVSKYPGRIIISEPNGDIQPRISVEKYSSKRAALGSDVTLACVAQGHPVPEYSWMKEHKGQGVPVALGERISVLFAGLLRISKLFCWNGGLQVRLEDEGTYTCHVNNSIGKDSVKVTLEVTATLTAHVQPLNQVVDVGKRASFQCIVGGHPVSQTFWLHNSKPVAPDGRVEITSDPPRLTIHHLNKDDKGMYQCFVNNDWDQAQAVAQLDMGDAGPELIYWFSEQTLQPGPTVSLKCVATGNPPPQFSWTLDGFPLPDHSRFLVGQYVTVQDDVISHVNITNIKSEDGGEYTCTAKNSMGLVSHSARVNVYGLPYIRPMPKITGVAGKSLIVKCPVAGYPIEHISWEKEGQTLPINRRQRVYANGTLVVELTQKGVDDGTYTCQAQNRQHNLARRDVEVQVIVPPKILPINPMTDVLSEGMRAAINCQIMEGDQPVTFRWERDGRAITNNAVRGIHVKKLDEYSSSLIIDRVTSEHRGNYTCIASNVAGAERFIVPLTVKVPPRWTVEPTDASVAAGQDIVLNCQAEGYPTPTITWKKAIDEQPGDYKDLLFESNVLQYPNGSLSFVRISKDAEGQYLCEAKNNNGSGVSKVVFLKVNAPARFPQKSKQVHVVKGEQAHLSCTATGDTRMEIMWKMGGQYIAADNDQRYSIREQPLAEGMVSELSIQRTIRQDTGTFTCSATNAFGSDEMAIQLVVQEIPEPPKNVRVMDQLSRSIGLSWSTPYTGNSPITNYVVQYRPGDENWSSQPAKVVVSGSQTTTTLQNLRPAQTYYIRVLAENRLGLSEPSKEIQVSTLEEVPSGAPLDIRAEARSSTELVVTWEPPPKETWNGELLGFHVGYQEMPLNDSSYVPQSYSFKSVEVRAHFGGEAVLQGLSKYTTYSIIVQAYNSRGSGPASDPVTATTLEDAPTLPPTNVQCSVQSAQSIHISWEPPLVKGRNGIIKGYKVTYHSIGESLDNEDVQTKNITQLRTTINGLRKYTNYSMTVLGYTSRGEGVRSAPVFCHTEEDVPSAPADIKAIQSAPNKILVSWLPPKFSNGKLTGYTFYNSLVEDGKEEGTHKRLLSPATEMHEVVRAQETATLQFWITASTRVGEGQSTRVVTVLPSAVVPARIASFGKEVISALKQRVTLHCKSVGIPTPTTIWKVNDVPLETSERRTVLPNATLIIQGLQKGDQANYSCSVENQHGKDRIMYYLRVLVTPDPPVLTVVESFTDSLHLRWNDQGNGGSSILGYVINYQREHGDWEELQIPAKTNEHMLKNLWCGTRYYLYITAYNRIGTGLPCDIITAHTKGTVPVKPKQSQMLTMNTTAVTIWLDSWGDGGCGILHFVVEYKQVRENTWTLCSNHVEPTERIYTVTDLLPATEYELKITAHNNAGDTVAIYNFTTYTLTGGVPILTPPDQHLSENTFYDNFRIAVLILISLLLPTFVVAGLFWRKRLKREQGHNNSHSMGESPSMAQIQNKQNRDQQYLAVRVERAPQALEADTYKPESADYIEDICPYATFQLSKPAYSESSYSGNVYSGPYHSVRGSFVYHDVKPPPIDKFKLGHNKEPEYTKVRRKGSRLRDPHSESQESDNLGSTDSEVKKILTLHLPISEYDTLGSDSEGDGRVTSQELMSFSHRIRGGAEGGSSSSSETSPPSGTVGWKPYLAARKAKTPKRHVRSSSGYSSHNDETTFSISHAPSFNERIHPPSRFSDSTRELSDPECEKSTRKPRGLSKLSREAFQINV